MTEMRHKLTFVVCTLVCRVLLESPSQLFAQPAGGPPPAAVHVAKLEQREVAAGLTFVGDVVAVRHSIIGSAVAGRVDQVYVREGEPIGMEDSSDGRQIGQPLVQLR